ncbi:hypothetical protein DPMN_098428 [Dreissena polymorpha]|uniref:Uncharacterized protein n=1 Tax=Dreissena polymorpha TaxID=45954 RepID=A0A9D4LDP5_DREPO|nr:hypothetical protein DPMN_098428 [Dreissena polymorpha]
MLIMVSRIDKISRQCVCICMFLTSTVDCPYRTGSTPPSCELICPCDSLKLLWSVRTMKRLPSN